MCRFFPSSVSSADCPPSSIKPDTENSAEIEIDKKRSEISVFSIGIESETRPEKTIFGFFRFLVDSFESSFCPLYGRGALMTKASSTADKQLTIGTVRIHPRYVSMCIYALESQRRKDGGEQISCFFCFFFSFFFSRLAALRLSNYFRV